MLCWVVFVFQTLFKVNHFLWIRDYELVITHISLHCPIHHFSNTHFGNQQNSSEKQVKMLWAKTTWLNKCACPLYIYLFYYYFFKYIYIFYNVRADRVRKYFSYTRHQPSDPDQLRTNSICFCRIFLRSSWLLKIVEKYQSAEGAQKYFQSIRCTMEHREGH